MLNIPFTIESDKALNIEDLLPKIPNSIILKTIEKKELTADEEILIQKVNNAAENALTPLPLGISAMLKKLHPKLYKISAGLLNL